MIFPELPDGFKEGCVFYDPGAHTLNFYILKDGVSPDSISVVAPQPDDSAISQIVPIASLGEEAYDALMNSGQLLRVGFDGSPAYTEFIQQKNAWERAFIDRSEYGNVTVYFRYLFMESKGVPPEVMARLLEATKGQFDKAEVKPTAKFNSAQNQNLFRAIEYGDIKAVRAALSEGADPNTEGEDPNVEVGVEATALMLAARYNRVEIAKVLIERGANVNGGNYAIGYPLQEAAEKGYLEMVTLFLSKGADVNIAADENYTALQGAVDERHTDVVEVLLKHGADPNVMTPSVPILCRAATNRYVEAVRLLLASGADVNAECDGKTPRAIAEEKGYTEIVNLLKQAGAP
jgi:ankyrin repeat protein